MSPLAAQLAARQPPLVRSRGYRYTPPASGTILLPPAAAAAHQQLGRTVAPQPPKGAKKPKKVYKFKHVRFNRIHVRLTYDGPPLSVTNFRLVS